MLSLKRKTAMSVITGLPAAEHRLIALLTRDPLHDPVVPALHPPARTGDIINLFPEPSLFLDHDENHSLRKRIDVNVPTGAGNLFLGKQ